MGLGALQPMHLILIVAIIVIAALGISHWPHFARLVRGAVLMARGIAREKELTVRRALGASTALRGAVVVLRGGDGRGENRRAAPQAARRALLLPL